MHTIPQSALITMLALASSASLARSPVPAPAVTLGAVGTVTRLESDTRWTAGSTIRLEGPVLVAADAALRIEAGTRVEAALGAFIVVARDGRMEIDGTRERPVVLTCSASTKYPGCWGGLIVQGNARINVGSLSSPAGPRGGAGGCRESLDPVSPQQAFGGCTDADSSGYLRFVRIEYAERGLQLQGVGSGTSIGDVQANRSRHEGVLVLGGTARLRELFLTANGTGLRWAAGWRGAAQAIVVQQDAVSGRTALVGQNASRPTADPDALPRSAPTLFNITVLAQSAAGNPTSPRAIVLEGGTAGALGNVFLYAPHRALDVDGESTCARLNEGSLSLRHVVTAGATSLENGTTPAACTLSEAAVLLDGSAGNLVLASAAGLLKSENDLLLPDLRPVTNAALANAPAATPPTDGFFVSPAFVGAVPAADVPARIPWFSGWTDPAPVPAPIPQGTIAGTVRSPFRGLLPNVGVREVESGLSTTTAANATFSLDADVGTALVELDGLPAECTAPAAQAVTVPSNATVTIELLVDCWPFAGATLLAPGRDFMCAIAKQGPHCWGANARGQLGIGTMDDALLPAAVSGGFTSITAGAAHACGRTSAADVRCWGAGDAGQLGNGALLDRVTPIPVAGGHAFLAVSAGDAHTCGVKGDGSIWCWGANENGQLGRGTTDASPSPVPVTSSALFAAVAAGARHTCALDRSGAAWCWGSGGGGEIGDGTNTTRLTPVMVGTSERFTALSVRGSDACGTTTDGDVFCWGENVDGALGDGTTASRTSPTRVMHQGKLSAVAAGGRHTCAISTSAVALCWGANAAGQLGIGTTISSSTPATATSATNLSQMSAGPDYSCAVTSGAVTGTAGNEVVISTRSLLCWGSNAGGQFGRGDRTSSLLPAGAAFGLTFR